MLTIGNFVVCFLSPRFRFAVRYDSDGYTERGLPAGKLRAQNKRERKLAAKVRAREAASRDASQKHKAALRAAKQAAAEPATPDDVEEEEGKEGGEEEGEDSYGTGGSSDLVNTGEPRGADAGSDGGGDGYEEDDHVGDDDENPEPDAALCALMRETHVLLNCLCRVPSTEAQVSWP